MDIPISQVEELWPRPPSREEGSSIVPMGGQGPLVTPQGSCLKLELLVLEFPALDCHTPMPMYPHPGPGHDLGAKGECWESSLYIR